MPQPTDEAALRPIRAKRHDLGVVGVVTVALDHDLVEAAGEKPKLRVGQAAGQLCCVLRQLDQRRIVRDRRHGSVVARVFAGLRLECACRRRLGVVGDWPEGAGIGAGDGLKERGQRVSLLLVVLLVQAQQRLYCSLITVLQHHSRHSRLFVQVDLQLNRQIRYDLVTILMEYQSILDVQPAGITEAMTCFFLNRQNISSLNVFIYL